MGKQDRAHPIAHGRTAEIYAYATGMVLKLFRPGWSVQDVRYEARVAAAVGRSGFPMAAVLAVVEHDGRAGIIYQHVDGTPLLRILADKPWRMLYAAHLLARLHVALHDYQAVDLPSQRERLMHRLAVIPVLPDPTRQRLLARLATLPGGARLCHGDFHPDNVLITAHGPVVIDWNDATRGEPAADVARSMILMRDSVIPAGVPMRWLIGLLRGLLYTIYRQQYRRLRPQVLRDVARWEPIVAAARLSEGVGKEEQQRLLLLAETVWETPD